MQSEILSSTEKPEALLKNIEKKEEPGWLSQLSVQLWLRSWSHGSWVQAPCRALCWQLRAWSLLPLSVPPPLMLCLSLKNKHKRKKKADSVCASPGSAFLTNSHVMRRLLVHTRDMVSCFKHQSLSFFPNLCGALTACLAGITRYLGKLPFRRLVHF